MKSDGTCGSYNTASFAALATRNFTTVLAAILICFVGLGIGAQASRAVLLHQFSKTMEGELAVPFDFLVANGGKHIKDACRGPAVCLSAFCKEDDEVGCGEGFGCHKVANPMEKEVLIWSGSNSLSPRREPETVEGH